MHDEISADDIEMQERPDAAGQGLLTGIAIMFLIHAIPAMILAFVALTGSPGNRDRAGDTVQFTVLVEGSCSVIAIMNLFMKQRLGWIFATLTVITRIVYLGIFMLSAAGAFYGLFILAVMFSAIVLYMLLRPELTVMFGITRSFARFFAATGIALLSLLFLFLKYWMNTHPYTPAPFEG